MYTLYFYEQDDTEEFIEKIIKNYNGGYGNAFVHACFRSVRFIPRKLFGFTCTKIDMLFTLGEAWNARFPGLPVEIYSAGISCEKYRAERSDNHNLGIVKVNYNISKFFWYLPLLVFRLLSKDEGYYDTIDAQRASFSSVLDLLFSVGTSLEDHNVVNPGITNLYMAFDHLSNAEFMNSLHKDLDKARRSRELTYVSQSALFKLIQTKINLEKYAKEN
jgi:hypothetical protein